MEYTIVIKQILNGLSISLFIIMIALGLSIIFGMMNVINVAHADLFMVGAYVVYASEQAGIGYWWALVLAPIVVGAVGWIMDRSILRFLYERRDMSTVLATWGFAILLQQFVQIIFTGNPRQVETPLLGMSSIFGADYPDYRLFVMAMAIVLIVTVVYVFLKTRYGILARAAIQDSEMAAILGINTKRMYTLTFVLGSAFAGIAGALMAPLVTISPTMGIDFIAKSFFAVIVGGMGGVLGVVAGGGIIGGTESLFSLTINATVAQIFVFLIVIFIVLLKPDGLIKK
jgi:urea transport system permease protein